MRYAIIGNGPAAIGAIEGIRQIDQQGTIALVSKEPYAAYSRPLITYYMAGKKSKDELSFRSADFYAANNVDLYLEEKATKLDLDNQLVTLDSGKTIEYDRLLIATGSKVVYPPIFGDMNGTILNFLDLSNAEKLKQRVKHENDVCVVGGGLIGVQAAKALTNVGCNVRIITGRILGQILDAKGQELAAKLLTQQGVTMVKNNKVKEIRVYNDFNSIFLSDGSEVRSRVVVVATGISPELSLVEGQKITANHGIVVDEFLKTSVPIVYAAGDVVAAWDPIFQQPKVNATWPNAYRQGRIAGQNMAGNRVSYKNSIRINTLAIGKVPIVSMGMVEENDADLEYKMTGNHEYNVYRKLVFKKGVLKGAILIGDIDHAGAIFNLLNEQVNIEKIKDSILENGYEFYRFLKEKRKNKLEGKHIQWKKTYSSIDPFEKKFKNEDKVL